MSNIWTATEFSLHPHLETFSLDDICGYTISDFRMTPKIFLDTAVRRAGRISFIYAPGYYGVNNASERMTRDVQALVSRMEENGFFVTASIPNPPYRKDHSWNITSIFSCDTHQSFSSGAVAHLNVLLGKVLGLAENKRLNFFNNLVVVRASYIRRGDCWITFRDALLLGCGCVKEAHGGTFEKGDPYPTKW